MKTKTIKTSKEVLEADLFALLKTEAESRGYAISFDPSKAHHWRTPLINRIVVAPSRALLTVCWGLISLGVVAIVFVALMDKTWATPLVVALPALGGTWMAGAYCFMPFPHQLRRAISDEWMHLHPEAEMP